MSDASDVRHTWYSSNVTQLILMSLIVFACPGMFNALNSIGLGGDPSIGSLVNCALYGTWMATSFLAPTVVNILGAKSCLLLGTLGYPAYALAMYYHRVRWGVAAGAFLGLTAGLLWTAQGQLMMSYPDRGRAGRFVAIFWGIFNSGSVLGCVMSFLLNIGQTSEGPHVGEGTALTTGTYWTFFSAMCAGCVLSAALLPLRHVTRLRVDGKAEYVVDRANDVEPCAQEEPKGLDLAMRELKRTARSFTNPTMLRLIPLFFYSNFFYSYHFGITGVLFDGRTASLTMAFYWMAQILGSFILQGFLDCERVPREQRLNLSFFLIVAYVVGTWVLGGIVQYSYNITSEVQGLDFAGHSRSPILAMGCLFLWGFVDSFVQVWSYWMMSQLSQEPEELACFTAFYKLWQCAGSFLAFLLSVALDSHRLEFWSNVVLIAAFIPPTVVAIRNHRFGSSDEAMEMGKANAKTGKVDSMEPNPKDAVTPEV